MPITVTNKTYGFITTTQSSLSTPVTLFTVPSGSNFMLKTIKVVDRGGTGGEIVLNVESYCIESVTVGPNDSIDCSPLTSCAIEEGMAVTWQSNGGADIHVTVTGILQEAAS